MRLTTCILLSMLMLPAALDAQQRGARRPARPAAPSTPAAPAGAAGPAVPAKTFAGIWEGEMLPEPGRPSEPVTLTLTLNGDALDGSILRKGGETSIDSPKIRGASLDFATFQRLGGEPVIYYWTCTIAGDQMTVSVMDEFRGLVKFTLKRQPAKN